MAETVTEACSRKQRPQTLDGTIKAIREDAPDPLGRLLLARRALKPAIGLRKGRRTGLLGVAQMPDDTSADNGREVDVRCPTVTMLFISQEIDGQR